MRRKYHNNTSFLDLLFNFLLATTILLVIAVLHIVVENNKADVEVQAEYVITVTWPKQMNHDVDTWIQDPDGMILWYRSREVGVMHMDRDDRGHFNDDWTMVNGEIVYNPNQEIITFRGVKPGEWIINLHLFRKSEVAKELPFVVDFTMIKLNPQADTVFQKRIEFSKYWQQETILRIIMDSNGNIVSLEEGPKKDLIQDRVLRSGTSQSTGHTFGGAP
jgi:hypothetical protein